jgi:hypothetical protein
VWRVGKIAVDFTRYLADLALPDHGLQLDNFCAHVNLPDKGCQEDEQLFKVVTQVIKQNTDKTYIGFNRKDRHVQR